MKIIGYSSIFPKFYDCSKFVLILHFKRKLSFVLFCITIDQLSNYLRDFWSTGILFIFNLHKTRINKYLSLKFKFPLYHCKRSTKHCCESAVHSTITNKKFIKFQLTRLQWLYVSVRKKERTSLSFHRLIIKERDTAYTTVMDLYLF